MQNFKYTTTRIIYFFYTLKTSKLDDARLTIENADLVLADKQKKERRRAKLSKDAAAADYDYHVHGEYLTKIMKNKTKGD